jgi:hypothetical protein
MQTLSVDFRAAMAKGRSMTNLLTTRAIRRAGVFAA